MCWCRRWLVSTHSWFQHKVNVARKTLSKGRLLDQSAAKIFTAYAAACIIYGNGQRSGVVTNLRIIEVIEWQPCDYDTDEVVIHYLHHKTGPRQLVVTREIEQTLLEYYKNVRLKIKTKEFTKSNRFFLPPMPVYTQVYRRMTEALSIGKLRPPRPKDYLQESSMMPIWGGWQDTNVIALKKADNITNIQIRMIPCWHIKQSKIFL